MSIDFEARDSADLALTTTQDLLAELASNTAGEGASMIGRHGGGTVEEYLRPDSYRVQLPHDAGTSSAAGTSGVGALQSLADTDAPEVILRGFYDKSVSPPGSTLIDGSITIQSGQKWSGDGYKATFTLATTDASSNGYFLVATDTSHQAAQDYDLDPNKEFGGLRLIGIPDADSSNTLCGIIVGGPDWRIHDIYGYQMHTVVRGADVGGTGDAHADHLRITNVHLNDQLAPEDFDPANPGNSRYGIDWLRTTVGADTAEIERCQSNITGTGTSSKRCRFIGLRGFTSALVRSIINGDIYLYQSVGVVSDSYFEHGVISNLESEMTIRNCHFWMRNEVTLGSDVGAVPVQMLASSSIAQTPSSLTMRDCAWNYDATDALCGYSTTNVNFSIPTTGIFAVAEINNCWRGAPYTNGRGWYQRLGITCGIADFDNYSHFASLASRMMASGTHGGLRWLIEARRGPISQTDASTMDVIQTVGADATYASKWTLPSVTYYYKAAVFYDKIRGIGALGTLEASSAATYGSNGLAIRLGYDLPGGGFTLRLYRGTTSGSYDHYVDVPVIEAGYLYDNGNDVGGFPWQTRTAGAADAVNAGLSGGIELMPGDRQSTSDAYGRCIATSLTGAMPTTGGWRQGDQVLFATTTLVGTQRQVGWRRLTDCTSGAPAHVLGTDWEAIYSSQPPANGQTVASGSTAGLTLKAGERMATLKPTAASQSVTVAAANEVVGYWFHLNVIQQGGTYTASVARANGTTNITLSVTGLYMVAWRDDTSTWVAVRIGDTPISGTLDEASNGFEQYLGGGANTVDPNARLINVSSASSAVALMMPSTIEQGGITRRLLVRSYTNAVTVAKSSGTVSSSGVITQTGLYELVFTLGSWLVTRLGNVPA